MDNGDRFKDDLGKVTIFDENDCETICNDDFTDGSDESQEYNSFDAEGCERKSSDSDSVGSLAEFVVDDNSECEIDEGGRSEISTCNILSSGTRRRKSTRVNYSGEVMYAVEDVDDDNDADYDDETPSEESDEIDESDD